MAYSGRRFVIGLFATGFAVGCGDTRSDPPLNTSGGSTTLAETTTSTTTTSTTSTTSTSGTSTTGTTTSGGTDSTGPDSGPIFDVADETDSGLIELCEIVEDMDAITPCDEQAPPDSFDPVLQWAWEGDGDYNDSIVTPLVVNLTDDNADGEVNLCDTPDVVVVVNTGSCTVADIFVLDGATGIPHFRLNGSFARASTPAVGDVDGDGEPEIVALVAQAGSGCVGNGLAVYEHDGTLKWSNPNVGLAGENAVALADLDNDGSVEILAHNRVFDASGNLLHLLGDSGNLTWNTTTAADLDDDGDLEVVLGRSAWHHDGTEFYYNEALGPGLPTIANVDDDDDPEILLVHDYEISLLEHTGVAIFADQRPNGDVEWRRPATVHDLDGDGLPEFAISSDEHYSSFEVDGSVNWAADVDELAGHAAGTAFDFLGDGIAEAIYGDETNLWVFDGQSGDVVFSRPRSSLTIIEYPVVVDVDNDGSAEIVVVSNGDEQYPTVQVFRDADDRWIRARRIWNQHTYHVTNVLEDGRIPQYEPKHWQGLNTFRTQAQITPGGGGGLCNPAG